MNLKLRRSLQYVVAGLVSIGLIGITVRYPAYSGIEGTPGYLFLVVLVGYVFALACDRVRRSRGFPFLQAGFFLAWGSYNALRGHWGLLTLLLLAGGVLTILWEGFKLVDPSERPTL